MEQGLKNPLESNGVFLGSEGVNIDSSFMNYLYNVS
jgi:hypothetical protein